MCVQDIRIVSMHARACMYVRLPTRMRTHVCMPGCGRVGSTLSVISCSEATPVSPPLHS